jgi:LDH2 family malate/lactate/ureidoglycolate dehydrogenase
MCAGYHKHVAPLQSFAPMARILRGMKKDGATVLLIPADHVIWSEHFAENARILVEELHSAGGSPEVWTMGDFSELARQNLAELGWEVHEDVQDQLIPKAG